MISLFLATLLLMQQDQIPRQPKKDDRGLLKIDPVYFDLAANTGGDFYFWAPGEFATSQLQVPIHREDVLLSYGAIESKKTFDIPVESGVKEMTLFAGIQRKDLAVLIRPDGTVMRDVQSFQHMLIATVKAPATGIWHLDLHGAGTYAVTAHVKPADDGLRSIDFTAPCAVALGGSVKQAELAFVTRDGEVISTASLERTDEATYFASCTLPNVPFRVAVRGVDASGYRFQRTESALHQPSR